MASQYTLYIRIYIILFSLSLPWIPVTTLNFSIFLTAHRRRMVINQCRMMKLARACMVAIIHGWGKSFTWCKWSVNSFPLVTSRWLFTAGQNDAQASRKSVLPTGYMPLIFIVSCEALHRTGTSPNHVQLIEFTTVGVQWRRRNISKTITRNGWHLNWVS